MTFWGQDRHIKSSLLQLKDKILGKKLLFANIKGSYMIFFFYLPSLKILFVPLSLQTMRNNGASSIMGQSIFFTKPEYLSITNNVTVQNSKLEPNSLILVYPQVMKGNEARPRWSRRSIG
jgi:hypothetical protein